MRHYWFGPFSTALIGLAWASMAVIALPERRAHRPARRVPAVRVRRRRRPTSSVRRPAACTTSPARSRCSVWSRSRSSLSGDRAHRAARVRGADLLRRDDRRCTTRCTRRDQRAPAEGAQRRRQRAAARGQRPSGPAGVARRPDRPRESLRVHGEPGARRPPTRGATARTIGVLYFDIDRFKVVNDSLGHGVGDLLLAKVASRLQRVMRSQDLLARLGGDEFTLLLDRIHGREEAIAIADARRGRVRRPVRDRGPALQHLGEHRHRDEPRRAPTTREALLTHADAAQYRAKQRGPQPHRGVRRRAARVDPAPPRRRAGAPRRARRRRHRRVVPARGGAAHGPHRRRRSAGALVARRAGRARRGRSSCRSPKRPGSCTRSTTRSCAARSRRAPRSRDAGVDPTFRIWCNVSAGQFTRARPTERLVGLLERTGCAPNQIGLEITETAILPDVQAAALEIAAARELGIKVALDDFGTGHSSLTLLRSLPIDRVKIDQTFVRELARDATGDGDRSQCGHAREGPRPRGRRRRRRDRGAGRGAGRARLPVRAGLPVGEGDADRRPDPATERTVAGRFLFVA